jgi:hypothetical protein
VEWHSEPGDTMTIVQPPARAASEKPERPRCLAADMGPSACLVSYLSESGCTLTIALRRWLDRRRRIEGKGMGSGSGNIRAGEVSLATGPPGDRPLKPVRDQEPGLLDAWSLEGLEVKRRPCA